MFAQFRVVGRGSSRIGKGLGFQVPKGVDLGFLALVLRRVRLEFPFVARAGYVVFGAGIWGFFVEVLLNQGCIYLALEALLIRR